MNIKPVIWVIDDEPLIGRLVRYIVQAVGLECVYCSSVSDFLSTFDPNKPAYILLDMEMPDTNGIELLEKWLERGNIHPVIVMTAETDLSLVVRALKLGAADFIPKPFDQQSLIESVRRVIETYTPVWQTLQQVAQPKTNQVAII